MTEHLTKPCTAFQGDQLLAAGPLLEVALAVKTAAERSVEVCLVFDDATGGVVELDLRGTKAEMISRLVTQPPSCAVPAATREVPDVSAESAGQEEARGRGRPKLGVVAKEVTLLPRHWDWLAAQPGGASVVLRRLVEEARRGSADKEQRRRAQEAAYRFMSVLGGNLPGYEEATRALFADDRARFEAQMAAWPSGVREYALKLAFPRREDA